MQAGSKRARAVETRAWLEQGRVINVSPSLKLVREEGRSNSIDATFKIKAVAA